MNHPGSLHTHAITLGSGAPVVLIHGIASSIHTWDHLLPALEENGWQAHALDLLGHGGSAKPATNGAGYDIEAIYAHFYHWLNSLKLPRPPLLIGHSLGAYLALLYAIRAQKTPRALYLLNPYYSNKQLRRAVRLSTHNPRFSETLLKLIPAWSIRSSLRLLQRSDGRLPRRIRQQMADDYKRIDPRVIHVTQTIRDLTPHLRRLDMPIRVAWGENDQTLTPATFPQLCAALPRSISEKLPGGHVPHLSHPAEFNASVLRFAREIGG
jgi:pimeloyl-ACP methyl ester carboxylesterase